jgi:hypothetical protein
MYGNCAVLVYKYKHTTKISKRLSMGVGTGASESGGDNLKTGCREKQEGKPFRHKCSTKMRSTLQLKTEGWESG